MSGGGGDVLFGGGGADTMRGNEGDDALYGGRGNDTTGGSTGTDTIYGCPGHDSIFDKSGEDNRIYAGDGEQDLICVNRGSGEIVTFDLQDAFISNQSCQALPPPRPRGSESQASRERGLDLGGRPGNRFL